MQFLVYKYLVRHATLILLLLSTLTAVTGFTIGTPSPNSRIERNAQFIVTWSGLTGNVSSLTLELAQGPSANALLTKATLATDVPAASGSETVSLPSTITSANNYYLRLRGNDTPASVAIQGPITIYVSAASSGADPSSSSFSLILPRPSSLSSSASLSVSPTSMSSSAASASNSDQQSVTSSSAAEETSNADDDPQDSTVDSSNGSNSSLSSGTIAGIAIGAVAGAGIIVGVMICVRRGNRDGDDRFETSSEIFASPPGYHAETKDAAAAPAPVRQRQEYASSPRQPMQQQGGQFYSTGYDNAYYNAAPGPYYQQQQAGYDQYNNYGYHPAAVYMPSLTSSAGQQQQQQQQYAGYHDDGSPYWDPNQQQHYLPEQGYYNSTPPHPQQQPQPQSRLDPPHSPTSAHN
ncbi:hypothetical protein BDB00DRAFT_189973 [Zychaea mexicana]|uniref:uncharacterized protein n=1 Tax=Zychaea mexicana TaxID=64656 RepID=UPI0022FDB9D9|nr:uncharacterized protein BDB00DRAFT_189973 [Zychaea mexicana]KAI9477107.1 hypothetical protein BDB00DRAFT_189973 [Zychaea mexicana]